MSRKSRIVPKFPQNFIFKRPFINKSGSFRNIIITCLYQKSNNLNLSMNVKSTSNINIFVPKNKTQVDIFCSWLASLVSRVLVTGLEGLVRLDRRVVDVRRGYLGFFLRSAVVAWTVGEEIKVHFLCFCRGFWESSRQPCYSLGAKLL